MRSKDYRSLARQKMTSKWGTLALIALLELIFLSVASTVIVGDLIVGGAFALAIAGISLAVVREKEFSVSNLFDGFKNFLSSLVLYILNAIFVLLWSLLFIIPGIIASYSYSMSYYILHDNPSMEAGEARRQSIEMMRGHKWQLFCLHFSFIGWILLSVLTFGILMFWVLPYMRVAEAEFYEKLKEDKNLAQ